MNVEGATNVIQLVASQIGKVYGGPAGQAVANYLTGKPALVASAIDLAQKLENGTATGNDVADVLQDIGIVLASIGVLAGAANPWVLTVVGIAGAINFISKQYGDRIIDFFVPDWRDIVVPPTGAVDATVNANWRTATTPPRRDPLAIDLDGNGIQTIGLGINPVLFDHNADGIRTGTGWLAPNDAWLVLDRDSNGTIDSERELFGVDTLITVTTVHPMTGDTFAYTRNANSRHPCQCRAASHIALQRGANA